MLTIGFIFSSFFVSSFASPAASEKPIVTIPLLKRSAAPNAVNISDLQTRISSLVMKYENGIAAYNINTGTNHPLSRDVQPRRNIDVKSAFKMEELIAENDGSLWQGLITVGNPTQSFTVSFDTGSADLILPGPDCTTECKGRTKYDPEASSSSVDSGNFDIYGPNGSVRGEVYRDVVTLAGLSVKNQTLGAALSYTSAFSSTISPADGVLGMAFGGVSLFETTPLIQALFEQKEVTAPVFAFKLAAEGAELSLGGPNTQLYSGSFTYVSVETESFWNVALDGVSVNGSVVLGSGQSMIDTGTPLILAPADQAQRLYDSISGSSSTQSSDGSYIYTFPCTSATTLSLIFGGKAFEVPATMFNLGTTDGGGPGDCVGAVAGSDQASFWVVGDTFLRNVYTSFDVGKRRVGFAALR